MPERKLSILAGRGEMPLIVRDAAERDGWTVQYLSFVERDDFDEPPTRIDLKKPLDIVMSVRRFGASHICLAGGVTVSDKRRDGLFKFLGSKSPKFQKPKSNGDTGLSKLGRALEIATGAKLKGGHEIAPELLIGEGLIAGPKPKKDLLAAGAFALETAVSAGSLDLGQAVVCSGSRVAAVEDIGGTDVLLQRVAQFRAEGLIGDAGYALTLAKARKPGQPMFVDLPAIGPDTITAAADAGIDGIFLDADQSVLLGREEVVKRADASGICVYGLKVDHGE